MCVRAKSAVQDLKDLLADAGWPRSIVWLEPEQCIRAPAVRFKDLRHRLFVFRPQFGAGEDSCLAQVLSAVEKGLLVRLCGLAPLTEERVSFVTIETPGEPTPGEFGFVEGVKVQRDCAEFVVEIVRSRLLWWIVRRRFNARHEKAA